MVLRYDVCAIPRLQANARCGSPRPPAHDFSHSQPVLGASFEITLGNERAAGKLGPRTDTAEGSPGGVAATARGRPALGEFAVHPGDYNCGNDAPVHWCAGYARVAAGGLEEGQSDLGYESGALREPGRGTGEVIQRPVRLDAVFVDRDN